ncbi:type II secretory pathway predicted ATPase ExeA [Pseudoduganella lurida]|uniref:Type II secretory pathway predicted ATPase ExeA n=1 Tax=Pseudoduganella lurida TaxID=1036180 RepID=A0A562RKK5_9BURK|nr:AAA family ATPase [Pseudoduganella lurida]TWI69453.1 type II secretory pathway predicted ATPase ExeA [Pseudoduganella lurida]
MYFAHFRLRQAPFSITPDPTFFYEGNTRGDMLAALLYAVKHGEGIVKVTGEVGSGKTMLCRMLESRLPAHVDVLWLVNPSLTREEVPYAVAAELGLDVAGRRGDQVLRQLNDELIARHAAGRQVVLLVEEAQAMPLDTLEAVRLLTNLETARHKLLQIVLFGQPELDEHLALPHMRQLSERITHSFFVPALPPGQVGDFLAHRLCAAGHPDGELFSASAARRIAGVSRGIIRRINILADKALLAAFADDADRVRDRHVRQAVRECSFAALPRRAPAGARVPRLVRVALALLGLALAAWLAWHAVTDLPAAPGARTIAHQTNL